eukprot:g2809.t1
MDYEDFEAAWSAWLWPARVEELLHERKAELKAEQEAMVKDLERERSRFEKSLKTFLPRVKEFKFFMHKECEENVEKAVQLEEDLRAATENAAALNRREVLLGEPDTPFPILAEIDALFQPHLQLWTTFSDFRSAQEEILNGPFEHVDAEKIEAESSAAHDIAVKLRKSLTASGPRAAAEALFQEVKAFRTDMPLISALANKALQQIHWQEIAETSGVEFVIDEEMTLKALLDLGIRNHLETVQAVSLSADKQYALVKAIEAMRLEWACVDFETVEFVRTTPTRVMATEEGGDDMLTYIIRGTDDIVALLDDQIVKIQMMRLSPYIKPIEKQAKAWERKLLYLQELLEEWMACQRSWLYLHPVFGSDDIVTQLPQESHRFGFVDALWMSTMSETAEHPSVMGIAGNAKLLPSFKEANSRLAVIEKGLNEYLETKRAHFPRFYFLGADELLEILSQTKNPLSVQPFLCKCFEGIHKVTFEEQQELRTRVVAITAMISREQEEVALEREVFPNAGPVRGCVEKWLLQLEASMRDTVRLITERAIVDYANVRPGDGSREAFVLRWPSQVVLAATQVYWTREVTEHIAEEGGLQKLLGKLGQDLDGIVNLVRGNLTKTQRKSIGALITIDVHARGVVQQLVASGVASADDFEWMRELRYYWEHSPRVKEKNNKKKKKEKEKEKKKKKKKKSKDLVARIVNAHQRYRYEYIGASMRLVITPLTDRCYRTMIGAVTMMYGGAPEGPAGTGKTETVKDLSKACAIQCVVFNCSDGLDYLAMAKFFKGLAGCGAWCCFDEFNRINIEVLSVIAQQILTIQDAKRKCLSTFHFSGSLCKLEVDCNVFITMNPGYAGRAELPDNLKALFRPCAMMVPDYALIAEIRLFAFGFKSANANAKKIVQTLQLSSELLSSQKHYDYGMRAVNTILVAAGNLRQRLSDDNLDGSQMMVAAWSEEKIVLRAINDVNLPKFTLSDLPLFEGITADLFPGVELPAQDFSTLNAALDTISRKKNLQLQDDFALKCRQLYETVNVRHGLMVVGRTCSGKTSVIETLSESLSLMHDEAEREEALEDKFRKALSEFARAIGGTVDIRRVFSSFDLDGNGTVDIEEFRTGVHKMFPKMSEEDVELFFRRFDRDGDGEIEYHEFAKFAEGVTGVVREANDVARVKLRKLNPKSLPSTQLYGCFNANTHEWTDGVLACIYREAVKDASDDRNWIVFDGPVDAVWIEDMNTVLDDNRKLCLMSGEIIQMSPRMTMMFETEDLDQASPATVSRVGMVFMEPERLGERALCLSWLQLFVHEDIIILNFFDSFFYPAVFFMRRHCRVPTPVSDMELAASFLRLLEAQCFSNPDKRCSEEVVLEGALVSALVWSVGAVVDDAGRRSMDGYFRMLLSGRVVGEPLHEEFLRVNPAYAAAHKHPSKVSSLPPEKESFYSVCFSQKTKKWRRWKDGLESPYREGSKLVVPTVDTARCKWLANTLVRSEFHLLFAGATGTGKTLAVQSFVKGLDSRGFEMLKVGFSARTSANQTQGIIDEHLGKRRKGVYGPPVGKRCIIFVDDLNMPAKEEYGAQPPIELLRQWMDMGGWYAGLDFRRLIDLTFVAAMGHPGGARTQITQRYLRHYNVINVVPFSDSTLEQIFGAIMASWHHAQAEELAKTVPATVAIFREIEQTLRPTPNKSHYLFNLRDLSKIFEGMLMVSPAYLQEEGPAGVGKLWVHECMRVFGDRLVTPADRKLLRKLLKSNPISLQMFFGTFADTEEPDASKRRYAEVKEVKKLLAGYLKEFNDVQRTKMELVLFTNAMEHISRIARVLNQRNSHALLVGVGGSGRKSLTTLATFICQQTLLRVLPSKSYGLEEWREDLRRVLRKAGVEGEKVVFLLNDTELRDTFGEDVNNLLNSGEVPNLFSGEFLGELMEDMDAAGIAASPGSTLMGTFVDRCRENLHLILCFSPIGDAFRTRLRMFPSIVNCCYIDWFDKWPRNALESVAQSQFLGSELKEEEKDSVVEVCVQMQVQMQTLAEAYKAEVGGHYYVTPTSYLELLKIFTGLLKEKRQENLGKVRRYTRGLSKLAETNVSVQKMQVELTELKPQLQAATIATDKLLAEIAVKQEDASAQKAIVEGEEKVCKGQADEAAKIAAECEADLAEALPALAAAEAALDSLRKSDLDEVKAMKKPPQGVKLTMEAVCILMKVKPARVKDGLRTKNDYWGPACKFLLGDTKFLKKLKRYNKEGVSDALQKAVGAYVERDDFQPDKIRKASAAAAGLCMWCHAIFKFVKVFRVVEPKKKMLEEANANLQKATDTLEAKRATVKRIEDLSDVLDCGNKLDRAERLMQGLRSEQVRWQEASARLLELREKITGDMLLSAGTIAYLGIFPAAYRERATRSFLQALCDIKISTSWSIVGSLGDPVQIRAWTLAKLPNDSLSIANAIMMEKGSRWPLMIDPQGQANRWVRNFMNPVITKLSSLDFLRTLENAIQFGAPVLVENILEVLDPVLNPILQKDIVMVGGAAHVMLGDSKILYDSKFRFYMTTKLPNPHFSPEVCSCLNLLNFSSTEEGLEDQMLGICVRAEAPDLEKQSEQLMLEDARAKAELKSIEDKILRMLNSSEGNILDDEELIDELTASKVMSKKISEKLQVAARVKKSIEKKRTVYRSVAARASTLFFCTASLCKIDPMYQWSMEFYSALYLSAIERSPPGEDRIVAINDTFTYMLYANICRSLFAEHRLLWSLLLCTSILSVKPTLLRFLLTGSTALEPRLPKPEGTDAWLTDAAWKDLLELYPGMVSLENLRWWKAIVDSTNPLREVSFFIFRGGEEEEEEEEEKEKEEEEGITLEALCLLRCLRMDALVAGVTQFVSHALGQRFVDPPAYDVGASYQDSRCSTPIIFVLSTGADPTADLEKFSERNFQKISLGQGQGPLAEQAIEVAKDVGEWVCLQNCHLAVSWLPTLEKLVEGFLPETTHSDFRLWLTTMPCSEFPVGVLQAGIKITKEPAKGMRASIIGSFLSFDDEWYDEGSETFKGLLYSLCCFHAAILERRKFGPLGWNIPYEFSESDLRICADQLKLFTTEVNYQALRYLAGECNYGGRVTDVKDRRTLNTLLEDFYNPGIFTQGFTFTASLGGLPRPATLKDTVDSLLATLPLQDSERDMFGLHSNANITCSESLAKNLLESMLSLQSSQKTTSETTFSERMVDDILGRIQYFNIENAERMYPVVYEESMNTVLTQELIRYNTLLALISKSLTDLKRARAGQVLMSRELENVLENLLMGHVPSLWKQSAYPSLKPLASWVVDLSKRLEFFRNWLHDGPPNVFWMPGFFFVQSFITGTRQSFARRNTIAIDQVGFDFSVMPDEAVTAVSGCYVSGLFIEGARWCVSKMCLAESIPKVLTENMPTIWLQPKRTADIPTQRHAYVAPVYQTSERRGVLNTSGRSTNFVIDMQLNVCAEEDPKIYVKAGVALFLQQKD